MTDNQQEMCTDPRHVYVPDHTKADCYLNDEAPSIEFGWWAERLQGTNPRWQPALQLDSGSYVTMDLRFPSEDDCLQFIRENIIGKQMMA